MAVLVSKKNLIHPKGYIPTPFAGEESVGDNVMKWQGSVFRDFD